MTNYELFFGDLGRVAVYIAQSCCGDCYVCPFSQIPCYKKFEFDEKQRLALAIEWLNEDAETRG